MDEDEEPPLTIDQRDVLRLCGTPRRTGDIAFLHREHGGERGAAEDALFTLDRRGLIVLGADGLWRQTDGGARVLRRSDEWEAVVEDVFAVSGRPRPFVVCTVRVGVIYRDDWFLRNGADVGRIASVESSPRRTGAAPADTVTLTVDGEVEPGDILTGVELLVS